MHPQPQARPRRFLRFVAIALLILFMPFFVLAATVAATGTVTVEVHEPGPDGVDLWVPVPALLVDLAVFAAPRFIPEEELARMRAEAAPYQPALAALAEALEDCPDAVLVEVRTPEEHVQIRKESRSFYIEVDSLDADVRVAVPARLLGRALDVLG